VSEPKPKQLAAPKPPPGRKASPESDLPPKAKGKSGSAQRKEKRSRELAQIEEGFRELLSFPSYIAGMKGDAWAANHFTVAGPDLARQLAAQCERNDQFRKACLAVIGAQGFTMLALSLFMYAAPPLMHWGLIPGAAGLGVPPAKPAPGPQPPPAPMRQEPRPEPAPAPAPAPINADPAGRDWEVDPDYFAQGVDGAAINADEAMQNGGAQVAEPPIEAV
jgi:hypothetical protein